MDPTRRALLIASPFQGLLGPLNDVKIMGDVLREQGFQISHCCGDDATREGILEAWVRLKADITSPDDCVVVYYAGHGGIVEDTAKSPQDAGIGSPNQGPWRYQFLVPVDFRADTNSFTGILDVELSHLLRDLTDITHNVTTIFDCCHSGRMARYPTQNDAVPRNLPKTYYSNILQIARDAADQYTAKRPLDVEGNRYATRVAAAASSEVAWEHGTGEHRVGVFTEALVKALREAWGTSNCISWRTTMMRVREMVNLDFPLQNPLVDGPGNRLLFSLDESDGKAIVLRPDEDGGILQAGRVSGVQEGNEYALMPLGSERPTHETRIGTAITTHVIGVHARADISLLAGKGPIPKEGAMAFLEREALHKWPVVYPEGLPVLLKALDASKYLRRRDITQEDGTLVEFRQVAQTLILTSSQGVHLASRQIPENDLGKGTNACSDLVRQAEQLAKAQHLLSLTCDDLEEKMEHSLSVTFGTVRNGQHDRIIEQDGSALVAHGESVYISLQNNGPATLYVSVFDINVTGKITLVSSSSVTGIDIPPDKSYCIGEDRWRRRLRGVPITWPGGIPTAQAVSEHLVLILTDAPMDLKYLQTDSKSKPDFRGQVGLSSLERLAYCIATGEQRDMGSEDRGSRVRYDTLKIPFSLTHLAVKDQYSSWTTGHESHELSPTELPAPEEVVEREEDLPALSPYLEQASRNGVPTRTQGLVGSIIRTVQGIPPYVWIVNEHIEDIIVVVSKYRPSRMLSGGGVDASSTGAGINFDTTLFQSPACKKLLVARSEGQSDSIGTFPLWTRKEGFGVISIFKGKQQELCVENDMIPLGATAYFSNKPDLRIVDYRAAKDTATGR